MLIILFWAAVGAWVYVQHEKRKRNGTAYNKHSSD